MVEKSEMVREKGLESPRNLTLDEFFDWDQGSEGTGLKYEWVSGQAVPAGYWMKASERRIVSNLTRAFSKTAAYQAGSELFPETECYLEAIEKVKIPDLAFFTADQNRETDNGEHPIPSWVIEITSPTDYAVAIQNKISDYFTAGVEVVWQIFPHSELVQISTSPVDLVQLYCDHICSAAPVLPEFEIAVNRIFAF